MADEAPEQAKETEPLGAYQVTPETMRRLAAMLQAVRDAKHKPPGRGLLLSALIYAASKQDGEQLESEIIGPYLRDHPEEEQPR